MDINAIIEKLLEKPLEFSVLIAVFTVFLYVASSIAKHPITYIKSLITQLINEFKPGKKNNRIETINASLVFFIFIITLLLLVGLLSGSVASFFIGGANDTSIWIGSSFIISLFLLIFSGWFSPHLIIRSREQKILLDEIKKRSNN